MMTPPHTSIYCNSFIANIWRDCGIHIYNVMNEDSGSKKMLKKDNAKSVHLDKGIDGGRFLKQGKGMVLHWEQPGFFVPC